MSGGGGFLPSVDLVSTVQKSIPWSYSSKSACLCQQDTPRGSLKFGKSWSMFSWTWYHFPEMAMLTRMYRLSMLLTSQLIRLIPLWKEQTSRKNRHFSGHESSSNHSTTLFSIPQSIVSNSVAWNFRFQGYMNFSHSIVKIPRRIYIQPLICFRDNWNSRL